MTDLFPLLRPFLFALDAETAHGLTLRLMKSGLAGRAPEPDDPALGIEAFGLRFSNPLGLAAGFDKNGEVPVEALGLGFGHVEVGTITPQPQPGNPRPRVFRLAGDRAVINRYGFNSDGLDAAVRNLTSARPNITGGLLGINIGANKTSEDRIADYEIAMRGVYPLADYITVNVSSPNTPGLRNLQQEEDLRTLLSRLGSVRRELAGTHGRTVPFLLKIAPDLAEDDARTIAAVAVDEALDGLIVSNTTIARLETLESRHKGQAGGLSGAPLLMPSTVMLARMHRLTRGQVPLIGVGGVSSGRDAYAKILCGARLVQLYTGLVYGGPALVSRIKSELSACLARDGFASVEDACGQGADDPRAVLAGASRLKTITARSGAA